MSGSTYAPYVRGSQQIASGLGQYYGNSGLSDAGSALGIAGGIQRGGVGGYGQAAVNAGKLYGNLAGSSIGKGAGALGSALGIYQGIRQGGASGYGQAAVNAGQLAGVPGMGYIAAPLALYNFGKGWRSGATGADAMSGATTGAEIGSYFGPLGTLAGGVIGGAAGALSSAFGPGAKDPETYAVQNVIDATSKNKNNPGVAASVDNPYLMLAGLMDRRESTLPEYAQYGRMGEQKFTNDLVSQINSATKANPTLAKDPNAMYSQVVSPWINKMGSGYSNVGPEYTATNQGLLEDMTKQYMSGEASQDWKSIGGQSPFSDIYQNSPYSGVAQQYAQQQAQQAAQQLAQQRAAGAARRDAGLGTRFAAEGGTVKSPELKHRLHKLYEGSFAKKKQRYDDGGGVDYLNYVVPSAHYEQDPYTFDNSSFAAPTDQAGLEQYLQQNTPSYGYDASGNQFNVNENSSAGNIDSNQLSYMLQTMQDSPNNPYGGSSALSGSGGGTGSILSGLSSLLGVNSLGQAVQKYGALAPILAAALGGNKSASAPATPAGYGAIPSIATPNNPRSYTQPNVANWYTYGQGPEQSFYSTNQLPTVPGVSPGTSAAGSPPPPTAPMLTDPNVRNTQPVVGPRPIMRAHGGAAFDATQGDSYVPDPGHGDGTSDHIDAKLSGGEYVMDAGTVSMLGNGSNEAGSRALDQLRARVRKHAGKQLVKGKQFMKAKPPEKYLHEKDLPEAGTVRLFKD